MKKYFIVPGDFVNTYALYWTTDTGYHPNAESYKRKFNTAEFLREYPNAERISRKDAIAYARAERARRRDDAYFSGYADGYVYPYGAMWCDPTYISSHTDSTGVIVV